METGTFGGEDTQLAATHEESDDEVVFDPLVRGEQAQADLREDGHDPQMLVGIERWLTGHPAE